MTLALFYRFQGSEAKRITLVLQQPSQTGSAAPAGQVVTAQQQVTQIQQVQTAQGGQQQQPQAPARLVLGQLPGGKLVLQGSQLAALTQARAAGQTGGQPKVLTIQLQVQQQPNQQGGVKVREKCELLSICLFNQIIFPYCTCFLCPLVFPFNLSYWKLLRPLITSCSLPVSLY